MSYNYTSSNRINSRSGAGNTLRPDTRKDKFLMLSHSTRSPHFPANLKDYAPWVATYGLVAPYGECQCGCGNDAPLAKRGRNSTGEIKGAPCRFVHWHNAKSAYRREISLGIFSDANVGSTAHGLTSDELIDKALQYGLYRVDIQSGTVYGHKGKLLNPYVDRDGYEVVTVYLAKNIQRAIHVHRMVAMAAWGADAIRDKQIGHKDQNSLHNGIDNLWIPQTVKEHFEYDGGNVHLKKGQSWCKPSWPPCVRCGDPDGRLPADGKTPARVNGERFGFDGQLCRRCYHTLHAREWRARKRGAL